MIFIDPTAEMHENQSSEHDVLKFFEEFTDVRVLFPSIYYYYQLFPQQ